MKKSVFLTKVCKMVAENEIRGNARELIVELAVKGECRPVKRVSKSYSDNTCSILKALEQIGITECKPSRNGNYYNIGWYILNDAPKGGKTGNKIVINFE